jgi:uncharacterized repeat protein (TIGR01451 family)
VVTKDNGRTTVNAGGTTTWTITVTNNGPAPVKTLDLNDPAPAGTIGDLAFAPQKGTYDAGTGLWTGANLAAGDSVTIAVTARISPDARGTITNTVTVTPNGVPELNPGDNTATDTDNLTADADVAITKSHPGGTYRTGDPITWTLTVTNDGPAAADDVTVIDTVPAGVTPGTVSATGGPTCTTAERTVTCTTARLAAGGTTTITLAGTVTALEGPIGNTATVSTTSVDGDTTNNRASDPETVTPTFDLWLTKVVAAGIGETRTSATWTIVVGNNGPSPVRDVITVTDTPTSGVSLTGASGTGWTCTPPSTSGGIVCTTGEDIEAGAAAQAITITGIITADPGDPVANTASVTAGGSESIIANNAAEASGVVPSRPGTPGSASGGSTAAGGSLPATGSDPGTAVLGLLFVAAGAILVTAGRRRC